MFPVHWQPPPKITTGVSFVPPSICGPSPAAVMLPTPAGSVRVDSVNGWKTEELRKPVDRHILNAPDNIMVS